MDEDTAEQALAPHTVPDGEADTYEAEHATDEDIGLVLARGPPTEEEELAPFWISLTRKRAFSVKAYRRVHRFGACRVAPGRSCADWVPIWDLPKASFDAYCKLCFPGTVTQGHEEAVEKGSGSSSSSTSSESSSSGSDDRAAG